MSLRPALKTLTTESPDAGSPTSVSPFPFATCSRTIVDSLHVHFPPTPILTSTALTHASNVYDRAPISVSPNVCALPQRGERVYSDVPTKSRRPLLFTSVHNDKYDDGEDYNDGDGDCDDDVSELGDDGDVPDEGYRDPGGYGHGHDYDSARYTYPAQLGHRRHLSQEEGYNAAQKSSVRIARMSVRTTTTATTTATTTTTTLMGAGATPMLRKKKEKDRDRERSAARAHALLDRSPSDPALALEGCLGGF